MIWNRGSFFAVLALGIGIGSQAVAGTVSTGTISYNFTGYSADTSCTTAPSDRQRENFSGTVSDADESISGANLSFSICNDPGAFDGGMFTLTEGESVLQGTITATDLGDDFVTNPGFDNETVAGIYLVTSGTVDFAGAEGQTDAFQASISENLQTGAGTGTFTTGAPEPTTIVMAGLGVLVIGLSKRRRRA